MNIFFLYYSFYIFLSIDRSSNSPSNFKKFMTLNLDDNNKTKRFQILKLLSQTINCRVPMDKTRNG